MITRLIALAITGILSMAAMSVFAAPNEIIGGDVETVFEEIRVTVAGRTLHITNAEGQTLCIYDAAGNMVKQVAIDSNEKTVSITSSNGLYIVKIGHIVRKIHIN